MNTSKSIIRHGLLGLLFIFSQASWSAIVTQPIDLNPGDSYRLVFVTAGWRNAESSDIAEYNDFVTNQANLSDTLSTLGTSWTVIGSTQAVYAKTNTQTDPSLGGVPIYNLMGKRVADNYADLWDGTLENPIEYDQFGESVRNSVNTNALVWTGTTTDGEAHSNYPLGFSTYDATRFGIGDSTGTSWITGDNIYYSTNSLPLYGISNTLTIQSVPLPAAFWLFASALAGLGVVGRRPRVN